MQINDKTVIVTGGASGLGAATAEYFAEHGARVALWDLDAERGTQLAKRLGGFFCAVDVADESSVSEAIAATVKALDEPRALVCCAGICPAARTVGKNGPHALDVFERTLAVNLTGSFNCVRLVAEAMTRAEPLVDDERGVIVLTASVAAYEGQVGQVAYAASKGGITSMVLPIARDLAGSGIRCNAIAPGIFLTPMIAAMPTPVQDALAEAIPFPGRLGHPTEFASLAREICENTMINGTVIRLDGAIRMPPR